MRTRIFPSHEKGSRVLYQGRNHAFITYNSQSRVSRGNSNGSLSKKFKVVPRLRNRLFSK